MALPPSYPPADRRRGMHLRIIPPRLWTFPPTQGLGMRITMWIARGDANAVPAGGPGAIPTGAPAPGTRCSQRTTAYGVPFAARGRVKHAAEPSARRRVPLFAPLRGVSPREVPRDLLAGCVLAGLLVPQGLGYAGIAGVELQRGPLRGGGRAPRLRRARLEPPPRRLADVVVGRDARGRGRAARGRPTPRAYGGLAAGVGDRDRVCSSCSAACCASGSSATSSRSPCSRDSCSASRSGSS